MVRPRQRCHGRQGAGTRPAPEQERLMGMVRNRAIEVPRGNVYDKLATTHRAERAFVTGFFRTLDESLPAADVRSVLEVGVGEGHIARRVRERYPCATVVGVDLEDPELSQHWNGCFHGIHGDATELPLR